MKTLFSAGFERSHFLAEHIERREFSAMAVPYLQKMSRSSQQTFYKIKINRHTIVDGSCVC